jgi:hypothetical protein
MTNTNTETSSVKTKAPKAERVKYNYPFETKAQILASQSDLAVCKSHLITLFQAQTADEQDTQDTKYKNRRGFMSSHAVTGSQLALKVIAGEDLSEEEEAKVRNIVSRYGRQLAVFSREAAIAANPDLVSIAKVFSCVPA